MARSRSLWIAVGAVLLYAVMPAAAQQRGAAEVRLNRGIQLFMADDYAGAERQFEVALTYNSELAAAHYLLGLTQLQLGTRTDDAAERQRRLEQALASFERSRELDPELATAAIDIASAQALLGRLSDAESNLQQFVAANPDEPLPHLFLAVLYYREARDKPAQLEAAEAALARAEAALGQQEAPNAEIVSLVKYYQALVFLRGNARGQAQAALREGIAAAPGTSTAERNEALLRQIEEGRVGARRPWDLTIQLGFDYDTNVVLRGRGLPLENVPYSDERDFRLGVGALFNYELWSNDQAFIGVGANTFHSWHCDIGEFNIQTYGANVYAGYSPRDIEWLGLGLRYAYDYSLVGNDGFLSRHRITPQVTIDETEWTRSIVFYQFDTRDYFGELSSTALNRDGDLHAVGLTQSFQLAELWERPLMLDFNYRYENFSTVGTEFATQNNVFGIGLLVPLPENFTFDFQSIWEDADYKNRSIFSASREARRDHGNTLVFGLTKAFNEQVSLRFGVDWTMVDSNVADQYGREPFTYDRIIYGLTLAMRL